jgi:hypothetical protein
MASSDPAAAMVRRTVFTVASSNPLPQPPTGFGAAAAGAAPKAIMKKAATAGSTNLFMIPSFLRR